MKRGFTLIELLAVVAIAMVTTALIAQLFSQGWISLRRTLVRMDDNQSITILARQWQQALASTTPSSWQTRQDAFVSDHATVRRDGKALMLESGGTAKHLALPRSATIRFAIESHTNSPACAIMSVQWESRYFRNSRTNTVRLVACGRRAGQHE